MAKNSIGQFIAALRKANGLTQQDVADRLNVSNKAVSRWERDECAPDISLIPAIAEMFGVTCDELLKGERISEGQVQDKREPKVEKQVKNLFNRAISAFKTQIWISLAVAVAGYVCMMGISYGAYRPVIGFAVMLLFEAAAFVLAVVAVNKVKTVKSDNELFEEAESSLVAKYNKTLGYYSYFAFFTVLSVIALSLPFMFFKSEYVNSVLSFESYLSFLGLIILILVVVFLAVKNIFILWITGEPRTKDTSGKSLNLRRMNIIQLGSVAALGLFYIILPYFYSETGFSVGEIICIAGIAGAILINIIVFIIFIIKYRNERNIIVLPGIRNILMIIPALVLGRVHDVVAYRYSNGPWERDDIWKPEYISASLGIGLIIYIVFKGINMVKKKR